MIKFFFIYIILIATTIFSIAFFSKINIFFEEAKMQYIITTKMAFLAQDVPQKKHHSTKSIRNNIYNGKSLPPKSEERNKYN
jgi:hypothetical protein